MKLLSKVEIEKIKEEVDSTVADLDLESKQSRLGELETKSGEPDFWNDQNSAKMIMSEIESLRSELETARALQNDANSLLELYDISGESEENDLEKELETLRERLEKFQIFKYLSGKYDENDAILSIHSGQGGTEANDWAEMLLRMYKMYAEKQGWEIEVQYMSPGTETGLSAVTVFVKGKYAYGLLRKETGVHRLVRLSPFNSQNLRQTSFAGVEVVPYIEDDDTEIEISDNEIEFKAVLASGAGGQNVNKTATAVQIRHIPTGITVHNSESRSQAQNRENAMRILRAKLWQKEEEKREKEVQSLKGDHKVAGWGNQIRNYVLHPYKLVKDLRTHVESSDPESILDGNLDRFVDAQIRIG